MIKHLEIIPVLHENGNTGLAIEKGTDDLVYITEELEEPTLGYQYIRFKDPTVASLFLATGIAKIVKDDTVKLTDEQLLATIRQLKH